MKRTLAHLALGLSLLGLPSAADDSPRTLPRPEALEQAADRLRELAPTESQAQGLLDLFLGQLPRLMDENADPVSLVQELQPQAERLLTPDQVQMLRTVNEEAGPLTNFGQMGREERRRLMRQGLERLSHPDAREWLQRIDSFEL
jgi:hypothetical protein